MIQIINTWDQLKAYGGDRLAITYSTAEARSCRSAHFSILRLRDGKQMVTDPKAAWYEYECKTFLLDYPLRAGKPKALAEAVAWIKKKYGSKRGPFVRNRMHDYVEKCVNDKFPIRKEKRD